MTFLLLHPINCTYLSWARKSTDINSDFMFFHRRHLTFFSCTIWATRFAESQRLFTNGWLYNGLFHPTGAGVRFGWWFFSNGALIQRRNSGNTLGSFYWHLTVTGICCTEIVRQYARVRASTDAHIGFWHCFGITFHIVVSIVWHIRQSFLILVFVQYALHSRVNTSNVHKFLFHLCVLLHYNCRPQANWTKNDRSWSFSLVKLYSQ